MFAERSEAWWLTRNFNNPRFFLALVECVFSKVGREADSILLQRGTSALGERRTDTPMGVPSRSCLETSAYDKWRILDVENRSDAAEEEYQRFKICGDDPLRSRRIVVDGREFAGSFNQVLGGCLGREPSLILC